ncbi:beta-lactamase family protein [Mycobacterium xenopi 4042]|uniref:Beta-lactamase family protein n=1 Tax=Mycobacterium xenopi 4042 TaxID=1299334 RepID=X7ZXW2_MYCXE|nr:beta-lactamase family protein [Mycobacterium xenopi 4042]
MKLDGNQQSIREACDAGLLAGAVTVVWRHGKILQVNEIGYRDVDAGLPMQRDTIFRVASMTKPVTVAAAMSLVDEGKLALRDPITRWLPEFADMRVLDDPDGPLERTHRAQRAILVEDLLTHTSGLAYGFSVTGPISRAYVRLPFGQGPTPGWPRWPSCRWCTSRVSGSPTAMASTWSACWCRGSRANHFTRSLTSESCSRWACATPGFSSQPRSAPERQPCTGWMTTTGCDTT